MQFYIVYQTITLKQWFAKIGLFVEIAITYLPFFGDMLNIPVKLGSSSLLVKIYYFVLIRKIGRIKNRLILTGIFIELGVIEIEYELIKINVFTKIDEEPQTELLNPGQTEPVIPVKLYPGILNGSETCFLLLSEVDFSKNSCLN